MWGTQQNGLLAIYYYIQKSYTKGKDCVEIMQLAY